MIGRVIGVPITYSSRLRPSGTHLVELERVEEVGQLAGLLLLLQFDVELEQSVERQLRLVVDVDLERVLAELDMERRQDGRQEREQRETGDERARECVRSGHPGSDKRQRRPVDPTGDHVGPTGGLQGGGSNPPAGVERSNGIPLHRRTLVHYSPHTGPTLCSSGFAPLVRRDAPLLTRSVPWPSSSPSCR